MPGVMRGTSGAPDACMTSLLLALLLALQAPLPPVQGPTAAAANEQLEEAAARYRAAIALNPTIVAYHESLARVLERQGRNDEALLAHAAAVELDSMSARSRAGYGALLLKLGRVDEALPHLQAAARLDPASAEVQANLAQALATTGDAADVGPGYHDYSGFADDDLPRWTVGRVFEYVFGAILGLSALALVGPLVGTLLLLLAQLPQLVLRRDPAVRR